MINPAITATLIAASRQQEAEEAIEGRLKKANAVSQSSAVVLELEDKQRELLDQALAGGTVKRTADGRLYLNEIAVADRQQSQGFMVLLILLIAISIIASIVVLVERAGG